METDAPPPQIPGYELLDRIGSRDMGTVYKARQFSLNRLVAIRVLDPQLSADPFHLHRLKAEAQAATLHHGNIVTVIEVGESQGVHYLVMELVSGFSLGSRIARRKLMTYAEACLTLKAVADALDYAWQKVGIIHGDLRPENILVDDDGTLKVSDFLGFSLIEKERGHPPPPGTRAANAYYLVDPLTVEEHDPVLDIRALGRILYHAVTGNALAPDATPDTIRTVFLQVAQLHPDVNTQNHAAALARMLIDLTRAGPAEHFRNWKDVASVAEQAMAGKFPASLAADVTQIIPGLGGHLPGQKRAPLRIYRPPADAAQNAPAAGHLVRPSRMPTVLGVLFLLGVAGGGLYYADLKMRIFDPVRDYRAEKIARIRAELEEAELLLPPPEPAPAPNAPAPVEPPSATIPPSEVPAPPGPQTPSVAAPSEPTPAVFMAYLGGMEQMLKSVVKRNYPEAAAAVQTWLQQNPGHPETQRMRANLERVSRVVAIAPWLEARQASLVGLPIAQGPRQGAIERVEKGVVKARLRTDTVDLEFDAALKDLPLEDLVRLIKAADPETREPHLLACYLSAGRFAEAEASLQGRAWPPAEIQAGREWLEQWRSAWQNLQAVRAIDAIVADAQSGRTADAREKLGKADEIFGGTEIFKWVSADRLAELRKELRSAEPQL